MTRYPPVYPPAHPSQDDMLRPARRAGVLMIVLGVLFVGGGLCYGLIGYVLRSPDLLNTPEGREFQQRMTEMEGRLGTSVNKAFIIYGAVFLGTGALLGAMGTMVRGGRRGPIIAAIAFSIVLALLVALALLGSCAAGVILGMPPAEMATGLCICVVPLGLLGLLLYWLIQAVRMAPHLDYARQQLDSQMSYYQQQQQYYQQPPAAQPGATTPTPPSASPPSAPPPFAPSQPAAGGYHQYPIAPPAAPAALPSSERPESGDPSDGPPAQG